MSTPPRFDREILERLDAANEVRIETRARVGGPDATHRTIIWIVADEDEVFVRAVRGTRGRWFRDVMADPLATLHTSRHEPPIPVRAIPARDERSIERCTAALRRKYRGDPAVGSMVKPEILDSTLRLEPDTEATGTRP